MTRRARDARRATPAVLAIVLAAAALPAPAAAEEAAAIAAPTATPTAATGPSGADARANRRRIRRAAKSSRSPEHARRPVPAVSTSGPTPATEATPGESRAAPPAASTAAPAAGKVPPRSDGAAEAARGSAGPAGASLGEVEAELERRAPATPPNPVFAWKQTMIDAGITPALQQSALLWSNVHGGRETGTELTGFFSAAFDLDLEKLLGTWHGLVFRIGWNWYQGPTPTTSLLGGFGNMSVSYYEASNAFRFYEIHLRQDFGPDDRWSFEIGQLGADLDFMCSRYAALYQNGTFGAFSSFTSLRNTTQVFRAPIYPLAAPGVLLRMGFLEDLAARLGVYTADAGQDVVSNWGFDWRLGDGGGATIFWELEGSFRPAGKPGALTVGGWSVIAQRDSPEIEALEPSDLAFYASLDQAILADAAGEPRLGFFARIAVNERLNDNPIVLNTEAGLNLYRPLAFRPDDVLGLGFGTTRFGDRIRRLLTDLPRGETVVELTYQAQLTPWLMIQPDLQWFLSPAISRRDALLLGLEISATY
jgi:porin